MHSPVLLFFGNLFSSDMIIIVFVALLLFGGEKLPQIARGLGKGIRDFKDASEGVKREINNQINNYEEKREDDKRIEAAITANQKATETQVLGATADQVIEGHRPVENTISISDSVFNEDKSAPYSGNIEHSHLPADEAENDFSHSHLGATIPVSEQSKNS